MPSLTTGHRFLLAGVVWPFAVAALALLLLTAIGGLSDGAASALFILGFAGVPLVVIGWYDRLPDRLPHPVRVVVAVGLGLPTAGGGVYLALLLFGWVALRLGWLE